MYFSHGPEVVQSKVEGSTGIEQFEKRIVFLLVM